MFTDTHCHLYHEYYDNLEKVIEESIKSGVNRWINNGCDKNTNEEIIEISKKFPNMYLALGIHPECVLEYSENDISDIKTNLKNEKVVAIGEIGLDFHYSIENKHEQIELLEKQLHLAEKNNLPVIIHSRDANREIIEILKKYKVKGVIHSFSGNSKEAQEFVDMGYLLGINGIITFKNSNLKDIIKDIPLDNIILETDSPYLTPEPFRGKQNSPKHIVDIARFICNYNNISILDLSLIINNNINRIFKI